LSQQSIYAVETLQQITYVTQRIVTKCQPAKDIFNDIKTLETLLKRYFPEESSVLQYVDSKGQDLSTYFLITYCSTKDIEKSLLSFQLVRYLVRYILLFDRFYEVGVEEYKNIAISSRKNIKDSMSKANLSHLENYIEYAIEQFWPFWKYEQMIKKQMLNGHKFSYKEIRHHNLFKSSDSPILYSIILESIIPDYTENISLLLHYNQALLDLQDDLEDIEDDVIEEMPNVFVMASNTAMEFDRLKHEDKKIVRSKLLKESRNSIGQLIEEYQHSIISISLPETLTLLKRLSSHYIRDLTDSINIVSP